MKLKADSYIQISKSTEDTIMPLLHQQMGFCSGVTQISPERSEAVVSERLGHASIVLTLDTYSHVLPTMQKEATNKLEKMMFG